MSLRLYVHSTSTDRALNWERSSFTAKRNAIEGVYLLQCGYSGFVSLPVTGTSVASCPVWTTQRRLKKSPEGFEKKKKILITTDGAATFSVCSYRRLLGHEVPAWPMTTVYNGFGTYRTGMFTIGASFRGICTCPYSRHEETRWPISLHPGHPKASWKLISVLLEVRCT